MTDPLPPATPSRRTGAIAAVVGVLVLAVIAVGLAVAVLSSREPVGAAPTASADPTQSAASIETVPSAFPSSGPSATVSASAAAAPSEPPSTPELPDGMLPAGSVVLVTADAVRIRSAPTTTANVVATMAAGEAAYVLDSLEAGPVRANGYEWYQVEYAGGQDVWPWQDLSPVQAAGWVAAGGGDGRFLELAEVACPAPITLERLAFDLTPWGRLVCLDSAPFDVQGTYGCESCDDEPLNAEPGWLADLALHNVLAGQYSYYPFIRIAIPPDLAPPQDRDVIRATLRVDDASARSCTYMPEPDDTGALLELDPIAIQFYCRERLVLDSFEVLGTDDFGR
jgi:hypothetical protein